jgi:hypothetical protein
MGGLEVSYALRRTEGTVEIEGSAHDWRVRSVFSLSGSDAARVLTLEHKGVTTVVEIRQVDDLDNNEEAA